MLHQKADRRCPCNLTYCQKQPGVRILFQNLAKYTKNNFFFSVMRTPCYNHRPFSIKVKFMTKLLFLFFRNFHIGFIILCISCNCHPIRKCSHRNDMFCINARLHTKFFNLEKHTRGKTPDQGIPFHRTVTDTAVHHHNRNILSPCQSKKIWPQFRFNQNNCFRIHYIHNSFCDNRQIKRKKYMAVRLGHDPLRHSVTCSSNDGYNDHFFGIAFFQFSHNRTGRDNFTHRRRMYPDCIMISNLFQSRRRHNPGTLLQSVIKTVFKNKTVKQYRHLKEPISNQTDIIKPVQVIFLLPAVLSTWYTVHDINRP